MRADQKRARLEEIRAIRASAHRSPKRAAVDLLAIIATILLDLLPTDPPDAYVPPPYRPVGKPTPATKPKGKRRSAR